MPLSVRIISITFNQPGFQPPQPGFPFHGAPFGPGPFGPGPFPIPPAPPPMQGITATVNIQVDSDHGSLSIPFTVPYNPPDLNAVHAAAVTAATQYFNGITGMLQGA